MAKSDSVDVGCKELEGFGRFVRRQMRIWNVPGVAVGIVRGGKTIYANGFGWRHIGRRLPVTAGTMFAIGSCTKAFTATALGILVDEGRLDWDVPIRKYVPSFKLHDRAATRMATVRDLLCHRTGLPRHDMLWEGTPFDRDELFRRLRYLPFSETFRSKYQYCNLMYMAAGVVLERLAGCSWERFVQERICEPLGMCDVNFTADAMAGCENYALGYDRRGQRVVHVPHEYIAPVGPAGSMNSHVVEMLKWVVFQMASGRRGARKIVSGQRLQEIHSPQVVFEESPRYEELLDPSYAMGWSVQPYRGRRRLTHSGCMDGFNANVSFLPAERIGVVVLTNVTSSPLTRVIPYNVFDRLLGLDELPWNRRFKKQADKASAGKKRGRSHAGGRRLPRSIKRYAGVYRHPGYGRLTIAVEGGKLKATLNDMTRVLEHIDGDGFEMVSRGTWRWRKKVAFNLGKDGRITSLSAALQQGAIDIVFKRTSDDKKQ